MCLEVGARGRGILLPLLLHVTLCKTNVVHSRWLQIYLIPGLKVSSRKFLKGVFNLNMIVGLELCVCECECVCV